MDFEIKSFNYNEKTGLKDVKVEEKGENWPVVYLIYNKTKLYVGETQHAANRFKQHLDNPSKQKEGFKTISIIFDEEYNKSAILDIEQTLIQLFEAQHGIDSKARELTNKNGGQSEKHNYYQREKYQNKVDEIWKKLGDKSLGLATKDIKDIRNSDLFKYSPFNTLTTEQERVSYEIIRQMLKCLTRKRKKGSAVITGGAGTGKSIVLINMIYTLLNAENIDWDSDRESDELNERVKLIGKIKKYIRKKGSLKIGFVVPMTSIRATFSTVFSKTKRGWGEKYVIGPFDVMNEDYDVIFVDESHRLAHRKGYNNRIRKCFDNAGLKPAETQLDLIVKRSRFQVLVYDENQSVKVADITPDEFKNTLEKQGNRKDYELKNQMRCKGGKTYTEGIDKLFGGKWSGGKLNVKDYVLKLYYDPNRMIDDICTLDKKLGKVNGLCRNVAGYSWDWISKKNKSLYDIELSYGGRTEKYQWNIKREGWILKSKNNEIGCIHTTQGYDLNYVGLIFGKEIDYDPVKKEIIIDKRKFFDKGVKTGADDTKLKQYIINAYKVMMMRGIKGCYVCAVNQNMRDYLESVISIVER